ncbi:nucleotidyltransferase domain-containing protein [Candidatus Microgenomates bacterium]|nr:nucleotidyltransferase domain-containing protein [Candidatus Microgenomates bacterium]
MDFEKIKPAVKKYLKKVKQDLKVEKVILFGSFAKGKTKEDSDVDLIVISSSFAKMDDDERLRFLYRKSVGFPYNLHVYGLTAEEFNSASPLTTLGEVKTQGLLIS